MRFENLEYLDVEKQQELENALKNIDILVGVGKAIAIHREMQELLERTYSSAEQNGSVVRSPEGFYFAITGRNFNISDYVPKSGYEDAGWSFATTKIYKKDHVFIADEIRNQRGSSLYEPGTAFAYGAFNDQVRYTNERTRILLDSLENIRIVPVDKLPKNLVNPLPDYEKQDDKSVIF